jgi:hypothetical protein
MDAAIGGAMGGTAYAIWAASPASRWACSSRWRLCRHSGARATACRNNDERDDAAERGHAGNPADGRAMAVLAQSARLGQTLIKAFAAPAALW